MPSSTGWSGKKLTIATVASLFIVGGLLAYVLWIYGELDRVREQTEVAWRSVASLLDDRYRQIENGLAATEGGSEVVQFSTILDQFRTSSQRRIQQELAVQAESWLADHATDRSADSGVSIPRATPALAEAIAELNESQIREQRLLTSAGGRLLDLFVDLQQPQQFQLAD